MHNRPRWAHWLARVLEAPLRRRDSFEQLDAIVVLGAPLTEAAELSDVLRERVTAAADLFAKGGAPLICVTGGTTRGAALAEAKAMADALILLSVPEDSVIVEDQAMSTAENAQRAAQHLLPHAPRVWIVTQPFHGARARYLFRRAGFDAQVWHITDSLQYRDRRRALYWLGREVGAWLHLLLLRRR